MCSEKCVTENISKQLSITEITGECHCAATVLTIHSFYSVYSYSYVYSYHAINKNIYILSDINECQTDNGGCTQTCRNTIGLYQCSCENGYELTSDTNTCVGMYCIITV